MDKEPLSIMTPELYRTVITIVDARMAESKVLREDFDQLQKAVLSLAEAQRRTEERLNALAEAQRRTEERLDALAEAQRRTEERLNALAEAQRRTEERLDALAEAQRRTEERLNALAEAQRRTEERLDALAEAQRRTEERLERLEATVQALAEAQRRTEEQVQALVGEMIVVKRDIKTLKDDMGSVKGRLLEIDYREKAPAYLGRRMRRVRVRSLVDLLDDLEAHLSPEEVDEVWRLDLLVEGVLGEVGEVWLALEVSSVVDRHDVERALQRAALLRRLGRPVLPAVAGEAVTERGGELARSAGVVLLEDGRSRFWEEALAALSR